MHETYSLQKDDGLEDFIKIGNAQQCPLRLTGQKSCSSYYCLEVVP